MIKSIIVAVRSTAVIVRFLLYHLSFFIAHSSNTLSAGWLLLAFAALFPEAEKCKEHCQHGTDRRCGNRHRALPVVVFTAELLGRGNIHLRVQFISGDDVAHGSTGRHQRLVHGAVRRQWLSCDADQIDAVPIDAALGEVVAKMSQTPRFHPPVVVNDDILRYDLLGTERRPAVVDALLLEFGKGPAAGRDEEGQAADGVVEDVLDRGVQPVEQLHLGGLQVAAILGKAVVVTADVIGRLVR
mmetsp:Transcript_29762/g.69832  ORF Transcript_29762/g.69832 Transcript_29762/m.69832 type:complete len:242 (+) Transcript_29762:111-836(+)